MLKLKLERRWPRETYTIGVISVNGVRFSESVEDRDRGLDSSMSLDEIKKKKIYGETAIPKGTYKVILSRSPKFANKGWSIPYDGLVPEIVGVKGFSGVRIHPANYATELQGCIAPGFNKVKGGVVNSVLTYTELMKKYLFPAWQKGDEIQLTIE